MNDIDHGALSEQADDRDMAAQQVRERRDALDTGSLPPNYHGISGAKGAPYTEADFSNPTPKPAPAPAPDPLTWQSNTTSELGALLYSLLGPFARISPHRKFPFVQPLPFRPGVYQEHIRAFANPSALVVTRFTGTCDPRSHVRIFTEPDYRGVDHGQHDMPTWGALTGGTGTWHLAEPVIIRPNCSLRVEYWPPDHNLPRLSPPSAQAQLCAHGLRVAFDDYRNDDTDTTIIERLQGKGAAETKAFLDELLEQARLHLKQELPK